MLARNLFFIETTEMGRVINGVAEEQARETYRFLTNEEKKVYFLGKSHILMNKNQIRSCSFIADRRHLCPIKPIIPRQLLQIGRWSSSG